MKKNLWKLKSKDRQIPFKKALVWIFLSTLFISGTTAVVILYYFHVQEIQLQDDYFNIRTIVQLGREKGFFEDDYLSDLMGFSPNKKINLVGFNVESAEKKLLTFPLIKTAKITKMKPHTLAVEYSLRKPIFVLLDYENTAMDDEGVIFPLRPYFQKNELPAVKLGGLPKDNFLGMRIDSDKLSFIFDLTEKLNSIPAFRELSLKQIDLEKMNASSLGKREIIVQLSETKHFSEWLLRMSPKEITPQLLDFFVLRNYLLANNVFQLEGGMTRLPQIIDLRIPSLAFILL